MTTNLDSLQFHSQTDLERASRIEKTGIHSETNLTELSNSSVRSSIPSNEDKSDNNCVTLEEENHRLLEIISMEKDKNETLIYEIAIVTKDLNTKVAHLNKIVIEKQKMRDDLFYIKEGYEKVQEERNKLLVETSQMRNQINNMQGVIFVQSEQIEIFENSNAKLIDELNYEQEVLADYKHENAMFKAQLKNISNAFISLKEFLTSEREKQLEESKKSINNKILCLQSNAADLKSELKFIEAQQKTIDDYKSIIFSFTSHMEEISANLRTQLNCSKSLSNNFDDSSNMSALLAVREEEYRKTFASQEEQIMLLSLEVAGLKKHNAELMDEINQNPQILGRRIHSNTEYISRMMKENQREINEINEIMDVKDQEINRLKEQLDAEQSASKSKSEEIDRLLIRSNVEQNNKYTELVDQIEELNSERVRLNRRIEQLSQSQHSLKNEISEKDRIIMAYVEKSKAK